MKKRILAILLCLFMLALLCACTAEDGEPSSSVPGESTIASSSEVSEEISIEESSILEEASLPEVSQPDESEPEISEPEESQPEISEPEESQPEISEPEVSDPPTLELPPEEELPPEKEATVEQVLRFDVGVGKPVDYVAYYYDFPEYPNLTLESSLEIDDQGKFYLESFYNKTICLNDGKTVAAPPAKTGVDQGKLTYVTSAKQMVKWLEDGTVEVFREPSLCDHNAYLWENGVMLYHGTDTLWMENGTLSQRTYTFYDKNGEVASHVKLSFETSYKHVPCEIRYGSGTYEVARGYQPTTVRINELVYEGVIAYDTVMGAGGTLYVALFYADYGEILKVTGGITHEEMIPTTEENERNDVPIMISVYRMEQEGMEALLEDPFGKISGRRYDSEMHTLPGYSNLYWRVFLRDALLQLANDPAAMEAYLQKQGISCTVTRTAALDFNYAPFTLMALTETKEAYFVTVKDSRFDGEPTYKVYSLAEYRNAFLPREATVVVNGNTLSSKYATIAYGETAMLPAVAVLEALGGNVEWQNGSAAVTLNGKQCFVHPCDLCIAYGDEEWIDTSDEVVDSKGDELLMRSIELQSFFDVFCPGVEIRVEIEENTVYITR